MYYSEMTQQKRLTKMKRPIGATHIVVNMHNMEKAGVDARDQIAGYIFMCNSNTKPDCFIYRVFGLPASRMRDAEKIKPCMKLFLFDFDVKLLYGPYVADSSGELAIEPYAFGGRFPAQVKFSITRDCLPLPEESFKEAIKENYYARSKFKQDLSEEQVNKLVSLFRPIILPSPPQPYSVYHNAVESQHLGHRGSSFRITEPPSHGQYPPRSDHINRPLHVPSTSPRLLYNQVAASENHTLASQPIHSQPSYQQHYPVYATGTYHPDHPGLYQHETPRYGTVAPQIPSTNSYYPPHSIPQTPSTNSYLPPPNPMPQTHISHQQPEIAVPSSNLAAAQWVAIASETPQTLTAQTSSSGIQLPYNDYYGQTQDGSSTNNTYMYYNTGTPAVTLASGYQYQEYTYPVEVPGNASGQVSETHLTYQSQQLPVSELPAATVSANLEPHYLANYYAGANPTY